MHIRDIRKQIVAAKDLARCGNRLDCAYKTLTILRLVVTNTSKYAAELRSLAKEMCVASCQALLAHGNSHERDEAERILGEIDYD